MATIDELTRLQKRNGAGYRARLAAVVASGEPAVPYLGFHLKDFIFTLDGNKDHTADGRINFAKRRRLARLIRPLELLADRSFPFGRTRLFHYFSFVSGLSDEGLDVAVQRIVGTNGAKCNMAAASR